MRCCKNHNNSSGLVHYKYSDQDNKLSTTSINYILYGPLTDVIECQNYSEISTPHIPVWISHILV